MSASTARAPLVIEYVAPRAPAADRPTWRSRLTREQVFMVASPLALLVLWEVLAQARLIDPRIFWAPSRVAGLIWQLLVRGDLFVQTGHTLWRLLLGLVAGAIPGLVLGLLMGVFRWPRAIFKPLVSALYPLPRIALFPLVLITLGLNERSYILMVALGPFFAMLIPTMAAVMNVEPIYLRVARSFKSSTWDLYRLVVFPAALPIIFGAIRLSVGMGLLNVVAVEFLNTSDGLGYMIWHSWQILSLGESMAGLITVGVIGFTMFLALDWIEKRALPWVAAN